MGNRKNIDDMAPANAEVLIAVLKLIDKYELYGQVAYPKQHTQRDVADIYGLAAKTKVLVKSCSMVSQVFRLSLTFLQFQGVFVNPALMEPFGLTLIEVFYGLIVLMQNGFHFYVI